MSSVTLQNQSSFAQFLHEIFPKRTQECATEIASQTLSKERDAKVHEKLESQIKASEIGQIIVELVNEAHKLGCSRKEKMISVLHGCSLACKIGTFVLLGCSVGAYLFGGGVPLSLGFAAFALLAGVGIPLSKAFENNAKTEHKKFEDLTTKDPTTIKSFCKQIFDDTLNLIYYKLHTADVYTSEPLKRVCAYQLIEKIKGSLHFKDMDDTFEDAGEDANIEQIKGDVPQYAIDPCETWLEKNIEADLHAIDEKFSSYLKQKEIRHGGFLGDLSFARLGTSLFKLGDGLNFLPSKKPK